MKKKKMYRGLNPASGTVHVSSCCLCRFRPRDRPFPRLSSSTRHQTRGPAKRKPRVLDHAGPLNGAEAWERCKRLLIVFPKLEAGEAEEVWEWSSLGTFSLMAARGSHDKNTANCWVTGWHRCRKLAGWIVCTLYQRPNVLLQVKFTKPSTR
jgi:hypothetical protein